MPHAKSNISRLTVLLLAAMLWAAGAMAKLNIKAGDYYFDNSKVQEFKSQLESDNLLYVYVDNMYEWLQDSINASHCDSTFINLVNGYHDIVTMLGEGKLEEVIQYQNEHQVLSDNHLWQIRAAYKGWRDESGEHEYDANSSKEAKAQFERDYKDIVSFNEIYMIHEGKTEIAE